MDYEFLTTYRVSAPIPPTWEAITKVEEWPAWWRGVTAVHLVTPGAADGTGGVHDFTWRSALPYRLTFRMETTRVETHRLIEGRAAGELEGFGRWTFEAEGEGTRLSYLWRVRTTKAWMNALAPFLRPAFRWNHDVVMRWGGEGLARRLGVPVFVVEPPAVDRPGARS